MVGMVHHPAVSPRQLKLGVFLFGNCNYHVAGWRHPDAYVDAGSNFERWREFARKLEDAKFDMLFIADIPGVAGSDNPELLSRTGRVDCFEPLTMLGALTPLTTHLGLVATCATTYSQPFNIARMMASLDQLSGGRIGWNLVTGGNAEDARNFNLDAHVAHHQRYAQAEEFADVVRGLWDSIDEGALVRDKASGVYIKPDGIHQLNYEGAYYKVRGPLGIQRSPQGQPVLIQAGKSGEGMNLACRVADLIFTSQATLAEAQAFYADIHERAAGFGRAPGDFKIMPGISTYIGRNRAEAEDKFEELSALTPIDVAMSQLRVLLGNIDLDQFDLDAPLPPLDGNSARMSGGPSYSRLAQQGGLTLRQVAQRAAVGKDHLIVKGTPSDIADVMEEWLVSGGADGFNLLPPTVPGGLDDFLTLVVPELQRRGLFRREYEARTLRGNLGLPVPRSRHERQA